MPITKCGTKLLIHSQTATEVWEWISNFITYFTEYVITYPYQYQSKSMSVKGLQVCGLVAADAWGIPSTFWKSQLERGIGKNTMPVVAKIQSADIIHVINGLQQLNRPRQGFDMRTWKYICCSYVFCSLLNVAISTGMSAEVKMSTQQSVITCWGQICW